VFKLNVNGKRDFNQITDVDKLNKSAILVRFKLFLKFRELYLSLTPLKRNVNIFTTLNKFLTNLIY
jgi:hypothetical protein